MPQGVIKKLVSDRGFGFIAGESSDIFFHLSSLDGVSFEDLQEGQQVEYEVSDDSSNRGKGPQASVVRVAG